MEDAQRARLERRKAQILLLVGLLYALGLAYALNGVEVVRLNSDFLSRWYATDKLLSEGRNLYDPQNGVEVVAFSGAANAPSVGNFYYPAHLLFLLLPLGLLGYPLAHFVWTFATQLFFFAGIWLAMRAAGWPRTVNRITVFLVLAAFLIPNLQHSIWGQFNTIAVLSLALCYWNLVKGKFAWAGVWAAGLTFKPQATLLALLFLLGWALLRRERWKFLLGAGSAAAALWLLAELLQPGWALDFLAAVQDYYLIPGYQIESVLDGLGVFGRGLAVLLTIALFILAYRHRRAAPSQHAFKLLLVSSLALGWLLLPIVGMYHIVVAPLALVLLFSALKQSNENIYRPAVALFAFLYVVGFGVFAYGLAVDYGLHIDLAEAVYKIALPLAMLLFAAPGLLSRELSDSGI